MEGRLVKTKLLQDFLVGRVVDGDTIVGFLACQHCCGLQIVRVRLAGIDAPELDREPARAERARDHLRELIGGCTVLKVQRVKSTPDLYGRIVCLVWAGDVDLSRAMLDSGWAVRYEDRARRLGPFDPRVAGKMRQAKVV